MKTFNVKDYGALGNGTHNDTSAIQSAINEIEANNGGILFFPNGGDGSVIAKQHRDAMYALADYFDNSYVIDLYKYGPVYDDAFKNRFYLHGHLNASGYILTARMIDSYIDYIIRHNPDDFRNAAFIGTGIKY